MKEDTNKYKLLIEEKVNTIRDEYNELRKNLNNLKIFIDESVRNTTILPQTETMILNNSQIFTNTMENYQNQNENNTREEILISDQNPVQENIEIIEQVPLQGTMMDIEEVPLQNDRIVETIQEPVIVNQEVEDQTNCIQLIDRNNGSIKMGSEKENDQVIVKETIKHLDSNNLQLGDIKITATYPANVVGNTQVITMKSGKINEDVLNGSSQKITALFK